MDNKALSKYTSIKGATLDRLGVIDWNSVGTRLCTDGQIDQQAESKCCLSFDQLKQISWLDDYNNLSIRLTQKGILRGDLKLSQPDKHGWQVLTDRIGQEWVDQVNARLFLAIAQDNLNEVIEAVTMGGLINANDRFGHSPLHYAAYKGNPFIVDYLLRHGGNPNTFKGIYEKKQKKITVFVEKVQ